MDIYEKLIILTSITSMITMILVAVAVVPHVKQGLTVIRDAILWVTFVLVVAMGVWLGLQQISQRLSPDNGVSQKRADATETRSASMNRRAPTTRPDPFYQNSLRAPD